MAKRYTDPNAKSAGAGIMTEHRQEWRSMAYLGFAFFIPVVIMYLIYLAMEIHPFGDGSVLVLDLNGQYVYFYEALRHFVCDGDTSLLYSFFRSLGGDFMGIYAYYIASPFSYIVCLFPQEKILDALLLIFLLKTGLCGFTFGFFIHKTGRSKSRIATVIFSMMYALSAYAVVQQHNSMWIDAVMWLPIISYAIEQLIKYGKFRMYVIFLSLTLMSNFYIGYMVCYYVIAYFFYYYFAYNRDNLNNPLCEKR
ncbi:MAG TPA: YfhO family protein, partial [Bacillota bacterium]|nr:YfhO family protein [Bacillota bacterium]